MHSNGLQNQLATLCKEDKIWKVLCYWLVINFIMWFQHKINIHKVRAHTCIQGNILADAFTNKGPLKSPGTTHICHAHHPKQTSRTPSTTNLASIIRYLQSYVQKKHTRLTITYAQKKWINNNQIDWKVSSH